MKIYHHNDLDGRCAAALVFRHEVFKKEQITLIELDYKDEIDIDSINQDEEVYILDFSFKPDILRQICNKAKVTWIDHHKTILDPDYEPFKLLDGIRECEDKKWSGCELTWMYLYDDKPLPTFVKLIGDRDKWAWNYPETAYFNLGLGIYPTGPQEPIWDKLYDREMCMRVCEDGAICMRFRDNFCRDYADSYGYEVTFEGIKCFVLPLYEFGSEAFGERFNEYDLVISTVFSGNFWTVGLYSDKHDCGKICKKYGGGGHTGTGGFVCQELPFKKS